MSILSTIVPIFIVIFLGLFARQLGFFGSDFLNQANRLVYYFAIPAMIFSSISQAALKTQFNLSVILICLLTIIFITLSAWMVSKKIKLAPSSRGTFIQSSFHGNLGYIGLAVAFYFLGDSGLVKAAIIAGFVMILQNITAVIVLQNIGKGSGKKADIRSTLKTTLANPVILSALSGIAFSLSGLPMPVIAERALVIIKGMALPLALLIIGASLSFEKFRPIFLPVMVSCCFKILIAPAAGLLLFTLLSIAPSDYLPGLIILAAPAATLTYIMGKELGGDPDFAVAAISFSTIFSSMTYGFWLSVG